MNCQDQSNIYLVIIPRNCLNDIHICGRCKVQYTLLSLFLKHKEVCKENDLKTLDSDQLLIQKPEIMDLKEINLPEAFDESVEKDQSQTNVLGNFLNKDETNLRHCRIENIEGQALCINPQKSFINGSKDIIQEKSNLELEWKRTLQNDEEDIATLLANQLSSETSTDDFGRNININFPLINSTKTAAQISGPKEKDENKVMHKGKIRKLFTCDVDGCLYKTLLRKDIERHSRIHTGERPFKCFLCEKAFNRTDKLLLHQRIHAGDKRYKCTKCDYASVDSGSLIKHLRVHNGERPFKCQLCSYRARDSSQLTVHLRTHTGDSPFICTNSKCKAAFKTNSDLKRHMVVHSEEKPHTCTYCPYKSTLKRNLQIHIQSQHPNGELKEFKCHLCPRFVLPTSRKLKNHLKKHHGIPENKSEKTNNNVGRSENVKETIEKQETYKKRRRKGKRSFDKIAIGIMNKAYDCKLCEASFVCQDSLITHQRYHEKVEEEKRKNEKDQRINESSMKRKVLEPFEEERKMEIFEGGDLELNDACENPNSASFSQNLKNAEILASLYCTHSGVNSIKQYIMIPPESIPSVCHSDEYASLIQN